MTVDADLQKVLDMIREADRPPHRDIPIKEARASYQALVNLLDPQGEVIHRSEDRIIPGPAGQIPARIYWPRENNKNETLGLLYYSNNILA